MYKKIGQRAYLTFTIILLSFFLFNSASFAQQISLNERKISLEKLLKNIHTQSGYDILFDVADFKEAKPVSINIKNASISEAMRNALDKQPFSYTIDKKVVVIKPVQKASSKQPEVQIPLVEVTGLVSDETGKGLQDVLVRIKNTSRYILTGEHGFFLLKGVPVNSVLLVTHMGYKPKEIIVTRKPVNLTLVFNPKKLNEVTILETGYQPIPKERATGSFVLIDSTLLNRSVTTNILDRLDGVTSGVLFNKNIRGNTPDISIRDRSTISANANPLVILDNFPYDGDLSNINPQDVKSITILKDAAAASIWGSRAGNGVIVITTKKGAYNQKPLINFTANITAGNQPDPYFRPQLTTKEYIEVEQLLFDNGRYDSKINKGYEGLSPAVEVMLLKRKNLITADRKTEMLDSIAGHDNRDDLKKYFYRKSLKQQYQLNANGGGTYNKYYFSMGYDKNLDNNVATSYRRLTINANNTMSFLKNKIEFFTGIIFSSNYNISKAKGYRPLYPYENVADPNGNPLAVTDGTLRLSYIDTAGAGKLLDWHYRPLDELRKQTYLSDSRLSDYRVNLTLNYKIIRGLTFTINYSYDKGINEFFENYGMDSYYTRNLINSFTQITQPSGSVKRPIPIGDIVLNNKNSYSAYYGRGQLGYEKDFSSRHLLNVIAGYEVKDYQSSQAYALLYGYDKETASNLNATINPLQNYPMYYGSEIARIPLTIGNARTVDRYISYYANASYTCNHELVVSASARCDESNLFGVKTNQKCIPLWSTGIAWNISNAEFYALDELPYLRFRTTVGYSGNVDKTTSAYLTTQKIGGGNDWGEPFLQIDNPPNSSLRWEKVKNTNFGIDFGTTGNRLTGSFEYWVKNGIDLIGLSPLAPQTGVSIFKGNSANLRSQGIDFTLNTINFNSKIWKWMTTLLFNYNTDKITSYKVQQGTNADIVSANYMNPLKGYSYYSIFSYKWRGLDSLGNPQSILNGQTSNDYASIASSKNSSELVYNGTSRPKYFGAVRNTISYGPWELSLNIIYKFKYYFRRTSLNNYTLYQINGAASSYQQADYASRWKSPGDELTTDVPSLIYPAKLTRDDVYTFSEILIEKADHIRLQDLQINYRINKDKFKKLPFSSAQIYFYTTNLGILWKATNKKIDPDYPNGEPLPQMASIGFKANF